MIGNSGMDAGQAMQQGPTNDEVDLARMVEVFDTALSSDNPAIKELFQKLIMMSVLLTSENPTARVGGPLTNIFRRLTRMESEVTQLRNEVAQTRGSRDIDAMMANTIKGSIVTAPQPITVSKAQWEEIQKEKVKYREDPLILSSKI